MKPYEKYKSTNIPWLPQVPEHWDVKRFHSFVKAKSICNNINEQLLSVFLEHGVVRYNDTSQKQVHKPSEDMSKYQLVEPGDFVMNNQQAWRGSVGISRYRGIVSPAYFVFSLDPQINIRYAHYLFRDKNMVAQYVLASKGVGSIQRMLNYTALKNAIFFFPSATEQTKIAQYLDWKNADIARLITAKKKQITLLEEQKRAIINQAVTKGLDPTVEMKDSGISWLGQIPVHWEIERLSNKLLLRKSGAWGTDSKNNSFDYICIRVADFNFGKLNVRDSEYTIRNYTQKEVQEKQLCYNDILIEKSGGGEKQPVGRTVLFNKNIAALCANFIEILRPNSNVNAKFLNYIFAAMYYSGVNNYYYNQTTGIQNLNVNGYVREKNAFPPLKEQQQIVHYIEKKSFAIDKTIDILKQEISLLQEYRTRLISDAVTGQIDLRDVVIPENITDIEIEDENDEMEVEENAD